MTSLSKSKSQSKSQSVSHRESAAKTRRSEIRGTAALAVNRVRTNNTNASTGGGRRCVVLPPSSSSQPDDGERRLLLGGELPLQFMGAAGFRAITLRTVSGSTVVQ